MKRTVKKSVWLRFDRILSQDSLRQILILVGALFIAFCISIILLSCFGGNWQDYCSQKHISKWVFPLYLLIDGNAFNNFYGDGMVSSGAVFVVCLIYIAGVIIFTGMLIAVISNIVERRVEDYKAGHIYYLKSGHYIIMGYDDMIPSFINHIFSKKNNAYVLILSSMNAATIEENLSRLFNKEQMKRIVVNYGFRTSAEYFEAIHLESSEQVYIVGNHSNPAHDAINIECVDCICNYLERDSVNDYPKRITCTFKDLDTYAAFKTTEIFGKIKDLGIEFIPYNFFSGWAKQVFVKRSYHDMEKPDKKHKYPAVYGNGIKPEDDKYVHLVFVGTTNFAVSFAMEAAHVLHFPNSDKAKTKITFIDINADKEKEEFIIRNRHFFEIQSFWYFDLTNEEEKKKEPQGKRSDHLIFEGDNANFLDVEFEFIKGDVFSQKVQERIDCWAKEHNDEQYLSIFLALCNQRENFVMGMNMPDAVYDNEVPVFIRQNRSDNFVTNLRNADMKPKEKKMTYSVVKGGWVESKERDARYAHIYPFGMNETAFCADDHSLKRAKLINYLYSTANYDTYKYRSVQALDATQKDKIWEEANAYWQKLSVALKWSNLYNSYTMRTKQITLRAMRGLGIDDDSHDFDTLSDNEVEQLAILEHNRWNVEKLLMGYRKPRKDEDKYEHPEFAEKLKKNKDLFIHHDIRPFSQLNTIKELDKEFSRYIPWIMKMTEK